MKRCRLKRYNFQIINDMSKENEPLRKHTNGNDFIADVSFPLFQDLYGSYVQMNDRFESVHIWNKELAIKNRGRWKPKLISKKIYDQEKQHSWNN